MAILLATLPPPQPPPPPSLFGLVLLQLLAVLRWSAITLDDNGCTTRRLLLRSPPQPRRPATLLPSAIAMTATATIALFPSSADGRHTTSAVIFAAILLLFNS